MDNISNWYRIPTLLHINGQIIVVLFYIFICEAYKFWSRLEKMYNLSNTPRKMVKMILIINKQNCWNSNIRESFTVSKVFLNVSCHAIYSIWFKTIVLYSICGSNICHVLSCIILYYICTVYNFTINFCPFPVLCWIKWSNICSTSDYLLAWV